MLLRPLMLAEVPAGVGGQAGRVGGGAEKVSAQRWGNVPEQRGAAVEQPGESGLEFTARAVLVYPCPVGLGELPQLGDIVRPDPFGGSGLCGQREAGQRHAGCYGAGHQFPAFRVCLLPAWPVAAGERLSWH